MQSTPSPLISPQVTYSLHTNVYYGVNDDNLEETVNHGLPAGSECTSIGCYRDSHRYSLHNKSCTIRKFTVGSVDNLSQKLKQHFAVTIVVFLFPTIYL